MKQLWIPAVVFLSVQAAPAAAERPNFLIIMADDCTCRDLPLYGGENARTPHINRLASEGITFDNAYLCEAMCQPSRAALYSGQFPLRNGCAWNHSASRPETKSLPRHLKPLGYRTGIAGKIHVTPDAAFPFEKVGGFDRNCVRNPTRPHDVEPIRRFMKRDVDQPFCLVVALVEPHVPWVMGDPSKYPPEKLKLPPNIADTARTREAFSRYLAEITYMDRQVGDILKVLKETGQAESTCVLFTSEQGAQFPGCKWTNWDTGLHTALVARWPGRIAAGTRTGAIVQYTDIVPTFLDAAGGDASKHAFDGTSFLPVLLGKTKTHRRYAYGVHNNVPEGPPYPIRTIFDGTYRYIRNLKPEAIYIERHLMGLRGKGLLNNPYWGTWIWAASDDQYIYKLVKRYTQRPPEQLYKTSTDPYELENLAGDPRQSEVKRRLGDELDRWMQSQGDPGVPQDTTKALNAARRGRHLFYPGKQQAEAGS